MATEPGQLIVISGPSGAGKSTVVRQLLQDCPLPLQLSVSATTRPPRNGEVDGRDYHFVSNERFAQMKASGEFLEHKEVYGRNWYGTVASQVDQGLASGKWVILEIDVQGALSVMEQRTDVLSFFVHPGTRDELERRLRGRATDDEAAISRRLEVADEEYTLMSCYKYEIINRDVKLAVDEICQHLKLNTVGARHA